MGLENLKSTFSERAGTNNSQIGGRHGGIKGSKPPHSERHSMLDNTSKFPETPKKTTIKLDIPPRSIVKEPAITSKIFENPLSSFPTPTLSKPDLPSMGNSFHKNPTNQKHIGWHSQLDLDKGIKPQTPSLESVSRPTFNKEQLASIEKVSNINPPKSITGKNNLSSNIKPVKSISGNKNLSSNIKSVRSITGINNLSSNIKSIKSISGKNNLSSNIKSIKSISGKNNLSSNIKINK
jgi:hypothetical protein